MSQRRSSEHIKAQRRGKDLDAQMCMLCTKSQKGNHGHHVIYHSEAGAASVANIITLYPDCHRDYHSGKIKIDIGRF